MYGASSTLVIATDFLYIVTFTFIRELNILTYKMLNIRHSASNLLLSMLTSLASVVVPVSIVSISVEPADTVVISSPTVLAPLTVLSNSFVLPVNSVVLPVNSVVLPGDLVVISDPDDTELAISVGVVSPGSVVVPRIIAVLPVSLLESVAVLPNIVSYELTVNWF